MLRYYQAILAIFGIYGKSKSKSNYGNYPTHTSMYALGNTNAGLVALSILELSSLFWCPNLRVLVGRLPNLVSAASLGVLAALRLRCC